MSAVMGLDLSLSSTGVVVLSDGGAMVESRALQWKPSRSEMTRTESGKSATLTDRQKIERLVYIRDEVHSIALQYGVVFVGIEGYAFSKFSSSVTGLAELGGVVRVGLLEKLNIVPVTLPVSQCRRFVVGAGNATKDATRRWLRERGMEFATDDEADAFVVALTCYYVSKPDRRGPLTAEMLEIIDSITKGAKRKGFKRG